MVPASPPLWVFLDFDGVIMESMSLKLDAYCHALSEYGFAREEIRAQQLQYAGMSRSRSLPLMFAALAGRSISPQESEAVLRRFNAEDTRLRAQMTLKPGAREFLAAARNRIPLVVVTGTPQEVIDETVTFFELEPFFREVCGYPPAKPEHLALQLGKRNLRPDQAWYVGDAVLDYDAALAVGMPFVGVNNGDDPFRGRPLLAEVGDLGELLPRLGLG